MLVLNTLINILEQGMCYAIVALGVYISYKILDFPDLSVDGTFPLGASVAVMLINSGVHFSLAMLVAIVCGGFFGLITGILCVKCRISSLLSGILTMTALLSINLVISGGKVIVSIKGDTLFDNSFTRLFSEELKPLAIIMIMLFIVVVMKIILDLFIKTKCGLILRATGDNEGIVSLLGKNAGNYKILGLVIANAFVAFAGSMYSQVMRYFDNTSGTGMVVIALASVIIGSAIFKKVSFVKGTTSSIIGAIIYTACMNIIIAIGLPSIYLKLVMAILFAIILVLNNFIGGKLSIGKIMRRVK